MAKEEQQEVVHSLTITAGILAVGPSYFVNITVAMLAIAAIKVGHAARIHKLNSNCY